MTKDGRLRAITVLLGVLLALSLVALTVMYKRNRNLASANEILSFAAKIRRRVVAND